MLYKLDPDTWKDQLDSIILLVCAEDIIMVPNIRAMNKTIEKLIKSKPGIMVYVRISDHKYFPCVGDEKEVEL